MDSAREDLISYLKLSAESRTQKAGEHPEDGRYAVAAQAAVKAAKDLAAVPPWDPRLSAIEAVFGVGDEESVAAYHLESNDILTQFGFGEPEETIEDLLDKLAEVAKRV